MTVKISNIRNSEGRLQVAVFENEKQFSEELSAKRIYFEKNGIVNGKKSVKLKLKPGTYGITVLDDEDRDGDMSFRFGVYLVEGFGFSNYYMSGMIKPDFSDFSFRINGTSQKINVKIRYF